MAENEYVNKVTFNGNVLMDITDTTAETEDVITGQVFYTRSGARAIGALGDATTEQHGLMSAEDKAKLDEFQSANTYLTQHQDISGKVNSSDLAAVATSGSYNDLSNTPTIPIVPTDISAFNNDVGYLTQHQDISGKANNADLATVATSGSYDDLLDKPTIPVVPINVSAFTNDAGYLTQHQDISGKANSSDLATVATSGNYNDLSNKPFIPSAISDLTDDSGYYTKPATGIPASDLEETYLTSFTETDPTVPSWAKQAQKPTYTAQEVGALPNTTYIPTKVSDLTNDSGYLTAHQDISGKADKSEIPTLVSELTNDVGYITEYTETDPTVPSWAKAANKPSYTASEVGAPTVSEMNTAIATAIGNVNQFGVEVVQELPTSEIKEHTIYFVPKTNETNDVYNEYIRINNNWEVIGSTQIDLSNYATKNEIPTIPTNVSAFTNDAGYITSHQDISGKVNATDLATVATTGDYDDLLNKPTIPTIPINVSTFTNDAGYLTAHQDISGKANSVDLATVATSGSYEDLLNKPTIPVVPTDISSFNNDAGYLTSHQDISGKANSADLATVATSGDYTDLLNKPTIPTKVSDLTDDSGHYTKPSGGIPATDLAETYLTQHQDISGKANSADLATVATSGSYTDLINTPTIPTVPVEDIQINETSILSNKKANIIINTSYGLAYSNLGLSTVAANDAEVKEGTVYYKPIIPARQHRSVFYGLAKAAGDTTQSLSSNTIGIYTDSAKQKIQNMFGITDLIAATETAAATNAHTINSLFMIDGKLCKTTSAIAIGDAIEIGTNCEAVNIDSIFAKKSALENAGITGYTYTTKFGGTFSVTTASNQDYISPYVRASVTGRIYKHYKYRVTFNNTVYILPGRLWFEMENNTVKIYEYLGNINLYISDISGIPDGTDNVPFVIISDLNNSNSIDVLTSTAGTYTIKIEQITNTQVKLPTSLIYGDNYEPIIKANLATSTYNGYSLGVNELKNKRATIAIGYGNSLQKEFTIAIGSGNIVNGINAFSIGSNNRATGEGAITIGYGSTASGVCSVSLGNGNTISGMSSIALNVNNNISGNYSVAAGSDNTASGYYSAVFGYRNTVNHAGQIAFGAFNVADTSSANAYSVGNYIEIIGNGTDDNSHSNARTLDWSGNERLNGYLYVGCNADSTGGTRIPHDVQVNGVSVVTNGVANISIPKTETISGTTPTITGVANTRYLCGECSTLSITPPQNGDIEVMFSSGTTATVLTIPSTVKFPDWFDSTSLESNCTYDIIITNGIYGVVALWT